MAYLILKPGSSLPTIKQKSSSEPCNSQSPQRIESNVPADPLERVELGLNEIIIRGSKGASKRFTPVFKEMLASLFDIRRGNALVFRSRYLQTKNESVRALCDATEGELVKKPLGKCTATQLGHYVAYLIITSGSDGKVM